MSDRDHLTKHLLQLAQRVGVEKVTMRGLAVEAGTSASSGSVHVAGKSELLDLLIEAVVNSIDIPSDGEREDRVVALYINAWRVLVSVRVSPPCFSNDQDAAANIDRATRSILRKSGLSEELSPPLHLALRPPAGFGETRAQPCRTSQAGDRRAEATFRNGSGDHSPASVVPTNDRGNIFNHWISQISPCGPTAPRTTITELRRASPVYHQPRTAIVDERVGTVRGVHKARGGEPGDRDHDAFTATDGPLIRMSASSRLIRRLSTSIPPITPTAPNHR